jgi:hypothetical protein
MPSFSNTWYGIYLIIMIINVFFHVLSFVFRNNLFTNKQNPPSQKFWMASGCTWIVLQHNARCLVWHWCGVFFLFNSFSISIINYILLLTILYSLVNKLLKFIRKFFLKFIQFFVLCLKNIVPREDYNNTLIIRFNWYRINFTNCVSSSENLGIDITRKYAWEPGWTSFTALSIDWITSLA